MSGKKINTNNGDDGTTGLLNGGRTLKSDLRLEAIGTLDEAHSFIGLAKAKDGRKEIQQLLLMIQNHLYLINAELACPGEKFKLLKHRLQQSHLQKLEEKMQALADSITLPTKFILYGSNEVSALLDVARAIVRRAERRIVALHQQQPFANNIILPYINRLSDALFLLARYEEALSKSPLQYPKNDKE